MKRKLALLMAFMMTATLVPASHVDAASRNAVNRTASATSSSLIDATSGVALSLAKDNGVTSIKGAKVGDYFELHLDGEGRWTYDPKNYNTGTYRWDADDNMLYPDTNTNLAKNTLNGTTYTGLKGAKVKRLSDTILGVWADSTVGSPTVSGGYIEEITIPMLVFFNGTPNGAQVVRVVPKDSEVTAGEYTYANVESDAIKFRVQKKEKISRSGNTKVQMIFDEVTPSAFGGSKPIQLKLPKGFAWDLSTSGQNKFELTGATVTKGKDSNLYKESDGRIVEITPTNVNGNGKLDSIYFNVAVAPDRNAKFGDVDVIVQNNSDV
ncbi:MAG: copper amine oxidase N-terminal domain-containing protein, partial [Lachnospiraceae bacterium]